MPRSRFCSAICRYSPIFCMIYVNGRLNIKIPIRSNTCPDPKSKSPRIKRPCICWVRAGCVSGGKSWDKLHKWISNQKLIFVRSGQMKNRNKNIMVKNKSKSKREKEKKAISIWRMTFIIVFLYFCRNILSTLALLAVAWMFLTISFHVSPLSIVAKVYWWI